MNQNTLNDFDIEIIETTDEFVDETSLPVTIASVIVAEEDSPKLEVSEDENFSPIEYSEWESPEDFENYVFASARKVPAVFDGSKNSFKRAFAYLEKLSEEITNGVEQDASYAELNEQQLRSLDLVEEGIESALSDISAAVQGKMTKTATKSSGYVYYVNPFIHSLARVLINGKVSQGKNIETLYATLNKKYKLNDREHLELMFTLNDFGHPIRSSFVDHTDMAEQYQT
jgi:hypothetical protein